MIKNIFNFIYKERKIPLVVYYWHLERLLTTFPLFHFFIFSDYIYYTLSLHLILFLIVKMYLKYFLSLYNRFNNQDDYIYLMLLSFSISLLLLIYILMIFIFLRCIIFPTVLNFILKYIL
jgi:hypothetical protein